MLKIALAIQNLLGFHMHFSIPPLILFVKDGIEILMGLMLDLWIVLGSINIFDNINSSQPQIMWGAFPLISVLLNSAYQHFIVYFWLYRAGNLMQPSSHRPDKCLPLSYAFCLSVAVLSTHTFHLPG